ncbi:MAG: hypothetical protein ABC596_09345 [Candidatus Methanosuratincola petrocarbonis]
MGDKLYITSKKQQVAFELLEKARKLLEQNQEVRLDPQALSIAYDVGLTTMYAIIRYIKLQLEGTYKIRNLRGEGIVITKGKVGEGAPPVPASDDPPQAYECELCGRRVLSKEALELHIKYCPAKVKPAEKEVPA